jgi:alpha-tubulin suppressor-like RCC1 family protein
MRTTVSPRNPPTVMKRPSPVLVLLALTAACSTDPPTSTGDDAAADVMDDRAKDDLPPADAADAPEDTAPDRPDASPDATPDAARDVTPDAAPDAAPDATLDATLDVTPDATPDAAPDAAPDATPDAALDRPDALDAADAALDRPDVTDALDAATDRADADAEVGVDRPPPPPRCVGPTCVLQVVAGNAFACARYGDGTAACWGDNALGQIGDGTGGVGTSRDRPTTVLGLTNVVELAAGASHVCARVADGAVWCWGANASRQVGSGRSGSTERNAVRVAGLTGAVSIACGASHSCAALADGTLQCWGANAQGQLGDASTTLRATPVAVVGITTARRVDAGNNTTCAALGDGSVRCWGDNAETQLGLGTTDSRATPTAVPGVADAVEVSVGNAHACALRADGVALCWGSNSSGQLGNPSAPYIRSTATPVAVAARIRTISAGLVHGCATTVDDTVYCWGDNQTGAIGDGESGYYDGWRTPTAARGLPPVLAVAAARNFTCAITYAGAAVCWGAAGSGQFGNGALRGFATPQPVSDLRGVVALAAGGNRTCAQLADGTVRCWGAEALGEPRLSQNPNGCYVPVPVAGLTEVAGLAMSPRHICARLRDGSARCWGWGSSGALGLARSEISHVPVEVAGLRGVADLALGEFRSCAALTDGTVRCWGRNLDGELGIGAADMARHAAPEGPVMGLSMGVSLTGGRYFTCAALRDRTAVCWGANRTSALGDGTTSTQARAVPVVGLTGVVQLAAGADHACARRDDGSVWCWGSNGNGQCGADQNAVFTLPRAARVNAIADVQSVVAGNAFTCALRADRTVWCWGSNISNQLGAAPSAVGRFTPEPVPGLTGVTAIAAGAEHACAVRMDGTVLCWGAFSEGQLGLGHVFTAQR